MDAFFDSLPAPLLATVLLIVAVAAFLMRGRLVKDRGRQREARLTSPPSRRARRRLLQVAAGSIVVMLLGIPVFMVAAQFEDYTQPPGSTLLLIGSAMVVLGAFGALGALGLSFIVGTLVNTVIAFRIVMRRMSRR